MGTRALPNPAAKRSAPQRRLLAQEPPDPIHELEVAGSQHLAAALLIQLPSGAAVYVTAIDADRKQRLHEALAMKGWLVGIVTFDEYGGGMSLVAKTRAFDPVPNIRLRVLAQRLLDDIAQLRLFRVRLLG